MCATMCIPGPVQCARHAHCKRSQLVEGEKLITQVLIHICKDCLRYRALEILLCESSMHAWEVAALLVIS